LSGWDVGDIVTLTLTVTPSASDTAATVAVTKPAGTAVSPAPTPTANADKSVWTAYVTANAAGEWTDRWTVTGTGAGTEQHQFEVRATLPGTAVAYATTTDLAAWLVDAQPPSGARRKLVRATRVIDSLLTCAVYAVDSTGLPTQATDIATLRDAVCAQVEWWMQTGDEYGIGDQYVTTGIGSVSLSRRTHSGTTGTSSTSIRYAPEAVERLRAGGLLTGSPLAYF
jgi:hypothetical protein